jgi:hypothetical protein
MAGEIALKSAEPDAMMAEDYFEHARPAGSGLRVVH